MVNIGQLLLCICAILASDPTYYEILGVSPSASADEIRKAYRALSKKYHPDVSKDAGSTERFQQIAKAYTTLSDPKLKSEYDRGDKEPEHDEFNDFIRAMQGFPRKPAAEIITIRPSLEQLYHGVEFTMDYTRSIVCPHVNKCIVHRPECTGKSTRLVSSRMSGSVAFSTIHDPSCTAPYKGTVGTKCAECPQGLLYEATVSLNGTLEKGSRNGTQITFPGMGPASLQFEATDLALEVSNDGTWGPWKRVGDDLEYKLHITLLESIIGFNKVIQHLSGEALEVTTENPQHSGSILTIAGAGMPSLSRSRKGDAKILIEVEYPENLDLTDASREILREILSA